MLTSRSALYLLRNTIVAALVSAGTVAPVFAADAGLYLYQIQTERSHAFVPGGTVEADLHIADPALLEKTLLEMTTTTVAGRNADSIRISVTEPVTLVADPGENHSSATFVVDHDEPAVAALVEDLTGLHGPSPTVAELKDYVFNTISEKTYRRSFDLASQVAVRREGDCTEHAVLLTALARATGKSARVVLGVLLLETEHLVGAYGHAWTEIHDGDAWRIADATKPEQDLPDAWIRHVPLLELTNEGPGYAMQMIELTRLRPTRVDLIAGHHSLNP